MYILLVEDEQGLREATARQLMREGIQVDACADGESARDCLRVSAGRYDALVLDRRLPDMDGLALLASLRAQGDNTPILMLTALGTVHDRVAGLDAGADDYLVKPFSYDELMARLRALMRRGAGQASNLITIGDLSIDLRTRSVVRAGRPIALSGREYDILLTLARNKNAVLTRAQIEDNVWHSDAQIESNIVDVYIRALRKKLLDDGALIRTVRGVGYALREER